MSTLYYGDNLPVLREHVASESVDLVYLDPPFNSDRSYNVLFAEHDAADSQAQIRAFEDSWRWDAGAERAYREVVEPGSEARGVPGRLVTLLEGLRAFLGTSDMMAYLGMMAVRLVELRRVLRRTGSIYLHCDPTASHYLKLMLDATFGSDNFRSEIVWKRTHAHSSAKRYGPVHDVVLFYSKGDRFLWNRPRTAYEPGYVEEHFRNTDADGRRFQPITLTGAGVRKGESGQPWRGIDPTAAGRHWALPGAILEELGVEGATTQEKLDALDKAGAIFWPDKEKGTPRLKWYADHLAGVALPDVWTDVDPLSANAAERLGYPTQKPLALLERIVAASSNPGDTVLDPFCGCGTAVHAAQRLGRNWLGVDVTHLAVALVRHRLDTAFPGLDYQVVGEPADLAGAQKLAADDPYQFQWWALHLIGARPAGDGAGRTGKKGRDHGVDGVIRFRDDPRAEKSQRIVVSVKAGHNLAPSMVRDLAGTVEREKAPIGVLFTMHEPTADMRAEAAKAGVWRSDTWGREYPRIQLVTVREAFEGRRVEYPGQDVTLQAAPTDRARAESATIPAVAALPRMRKSKDEG